MAVMVKDAFFNCLNKIFKWKKCCICGSPIADNVEYLTKDNNGKKQYCCHTCYCISLHG